MFKLIVIGKNGREEGEFSTQQEAQDHFDLHHAKGHWGSDARSIPHEEIPAKEEIRNELDEVIQEATPAIPAWIEEIPAEYTYEIVPIVPVLENISPRQISLALLSMGITESHIETAINGLPSPQKEQALIAWRRSNYFVRTEPAVAAVGQLLNLTSEELDQIWILGITL